jgi:hypothetical protein
MKKKRKPTKEESNDFYNGFFDWLGSEDGEAAWQAFDDVAESFIGADLDINERKIIWADGKRLTIDQSAKRIQQQSEAGLNVIKHQILLWLEMEFVPKGLKEKEMEVFEAQIGRWIEEYESGEKES